MPAQPGRIMLIALNTGTFAVPIWTLVAGVRTRTFKIGTEMVDITTSDSIGQWRELLANASVKAISVSGSGVFQDVAIDETIRAANFANTIVDVRLTIPDYGTIRSNFIFTQIEYAGEFNKEVTYNISLESSGAPTFAAI